MSDLTALADVIDLLRAKGVTVYRADGLELHLGPVPEVAEKPARLAADEANCKCGHPVWGHVNGACIEGCDETKCGEATQ